MLVPGEVWVQFSHEAFGERKEKFSVESGIASLKDTVYKAFAPHLHTTVQGVGTHT
jgi:hypothetical protein